MKIESNTSRTISLNGSNYYMWKGKIKDFVYCRDYHAPISSKSTKPKDKIDEEWKQLNRQVYGYIRQWVDDDVYNHILNENNTYALWSKLDELYTKKMGGNKLHLIKKIMNLK